MDRKGSRTKNRYGHPPDRGEASAGVGLARETKGEAATHHHSHHQPPSPIVSDFTPRAVGTGATENKKAECLAKRTSRISIQATPALWEPMVVP